MSNSGHFEDGDQANQETQPIYLYLASFEDKQGMLVNGQRVPISGEMLVVQSTDESGAPVIEAIQRFTMWSQPVEEFGGVLSLAGLVNELKVSPASQGEVNPFDMNIYFPPLGQLEPVYVESDAEFVLLEKMRGQLSWTMVSSDTPNSFFLRIILELNEIVGKPPPVDNFPQQIIFKANLEFFRLEKSGKRAIQHRSLSACSDSAPAASGTEHDTLNLKLRFVNLSADSAEEASLLEPFVDDWVNGSCEVWWQKAGVRIDPVFVGTDGTSIVDQSNAGYSDLNYAAESDLPTVYTATDVNAVEIYLVHKLNGDTDNPRTGGGVSKKCGGNDAYVILEIEKAKNNRYLLAHELGHVLGLRHPNDSAPPAPDISYVEGSGSSIMTPNSPNSSRNTANNLLTLGQFPIGSVLTSYVGTCNWDDDGILAPQNYYHVIRDFPYDDGTESSIPYPQPSVSSWETHSSVWNAHQEPDSRNDPNNKYADGTDMFNADHSPNYMPGNEPTYLGENWMYVRVHACQKLIHPVKVYLYIAHPGSASEKLKSLLPNTYEAKGYLNFSGPSFPKMGEPKTKGVRWEWDAVGYPAHSCVYAVANSINEPDPPATELPPHISDIITDPTAYACYVLFNRLASDNNVAGRSLNVQGTPPTPPLSPARSGASSSSMLAWVQMDNPFGKAAPASLEIDATQAQGLESLALEADDEIISEIKPGERTSITLTETLQPEDRMIIRFRATLLPDATEGMSFPIHLRFVVNDQFVSGYTHVLRVAPLPEVVLQVLDLLYGALRDVAVGCKADQAHLLAERVKQIVLRERVRVKPSNAWRSKVTKLATKTAALSQSLEDKNDPVRQVVCKHLYALADLLRTSKDTPAPIFIEQIRELADRIQEPAGRLVRRQLKA
jgi:hypothetical protein